ncbi:MAG: hypothetical protein Q4D82_01195 [Neisseria sp.]|nr:hypothetical protein [Neisseria sp.]
MQTAFYGKISSGAAVSQTKLPDGKRISAQKIEDLDSYIGFKGRYPLGGGSSLIWQFEQPSPAAESLGERFRRQKESGRDFSFSR